jgi:hypothetical protein
MFLPPKSIRSISSTRGSIARGLILAIEEKRSHNNGKKHDLLGSKENPPLGFIPRVKPSVGGGWLST